MNEKDILKEEREQIEELKKKNELYRLIEFFATDWDVELNKAEIKHLYDIIEENDEEEFFNPIWHYSIYLIKLGNGKVYIAYGKVRKETLKEQLAKLVKVSFQTFIEDIKPYVDINEVAKIIGKELGKGNNINIEALQHIIENEKIKIYKYGGEINTEVVKSVFRVKLIPFLLDNVVYIEEYGTLDKELIDILKLYYFNFRHYVDSDMQMFEPNMLIFTYSTAGKTAFAKYYSGRDPVMSQTLPNLFGFSTANEVYESELNTTTKHIFFDEFISSEHLRKFPAFLIPALNTLIENGSGEIGKGGRKLKVKCMVAFSVLGNVEGEGATTWKHFAETEIEVNPMAVGKRFSLLFFRRFPESNVRPIVKRVKEYGKRKRKEERKKEKKRDEILHNPILREIALKVCNSLTDIALKYDILYTKLKAYEEYEERVKNLLLSIPTTKSTRKIKDFISSAVANYYRFNGLLMFKTFDCAFRELSEEELFLLYKGNYKHIEDKIAKFIQQKFEEYAEYFINIFYKSISELFGYIEPKSMEILKILLLENLSIAGKALVLMVYTAFKDGKIQFGIEYQYEDLAEYFDKLIDLWPKVFKKEVPYFRRFGDIYSNLSNSVIKALYESFGIELIVKQSIKLFKVSPLFNNVITIIDEILNSNKPSSSIETSPNIEHQETPPTPLPQENITAVTGITGTTGTNNNKSINIEHNINSVASNASNASDSSDGSGKEGGKELKGISNIETSNEIIPNIEELDAEDYSILDFISWNRHAVEIYKFISTLPNGNEKLKKLKQMGLIYVLSINGEIGLTQKGQMILNELKKKYANV